jgi:RND family efflux transporter MFP subunit
MSERQHATIGMHAGSGAAPLRAGRDRLFHQTRLAAFIGLALLVCGAALTFGLRHVHATALQTDTEHQSRQYVSVQVARPGADTEAIGQPGTLQGNIESPIYARTSGYVVRWKHDIGAAVRQGDILAELDTPEIDQQLAQAAAVEHQAAASLDLARTSAERWEHLRSKDAVSQQDLDEKRSALEQANANWRAAQANTKRLKDLESFKQVTAPFAGVITRRNIDVGDLVDAGSNGGNARALFTLTQTNPLRVYVYVPQLYAGQVHVGQSVDITQAELVGQHFGGRITHTAGAIDPVSRTLQVDIQLPNPHGTLLPGAFVDVHMASVAGHHLVVPSNALVFRAQGTQVVVADQSTDGAQAHLHLVPVTVGRDFGKTVELLSGIHDGDAVVLNPSDALADGDTVTIKQPTPEKPKS